MSFVFIVAFYVVIKMVDVLHIRFLNYHEVVKKTDMPLNKK